MSVVITQWYGRLGNNVIQIVNALLVAEHADIRKVIIPPHDLLNEHGNIYVYNTEDEREHDNISKTMTVYCLKDNLHCGNVSL